MNFLKSFIHVKNDKEQYNQLWSRLQELIKEHNIDPSQENEIKNQINTIRKRNGLAVFSQLKELKELKLKPYRLKDDAVPTQAITQCKRCGAMLSQDATDCEDCIRQGFHGPFDIYRGQPHPAKPSDKGKQPSPFGVNKDVFIPKNTPIIAAKKHHIKHDNAEKNEEIVKDVYVSDEFNMCLDPFKKNIRKNRNNSDNKLEDIWKSCQDLEIDG